MYMYLSIDRYEILGRKVHMDFVQEHLKTKKKVNFGNTQERPNNIKLKILADTVYVKVRDLYYFEASQRYWLK